MAITVAAGTINLRYAASGARINATLALEGLNLTSNAAELPAAEAAVAQAIIKVVAAGGAAVVTGSTVKVLESTVKVLAPATTGTYVNGYTFTIVNGVITAVVAS